MGEIINVYCDESCHLEHDGQAVMVLGALWCPLDKAHEVARRVREIKQRHGLPKTFELKWTKVSPAKLPFYLDVLDYFFDDDDLHFRAVVIPDKAQLRHGEFGQDHDDWYYKMYFTLLKALLDPKDEYRVYLDVKDTRSARKIGKLHDVLCNALLDFDRRIVTRLQTVRSHEVEQVQIADLLAGIVSWTNRFETGSPAKLALVQRARKRSHYSLKQTTLLREGKFNVFVWRPQEPAT